MGACKCKVVVVINIGALGCLFCVGAYYPNFMVYNAFHFRKGKPVKWSEVAGLNDVDITTTQCEAYATVNQGRKYKDVTVTQPPSSETEYDIPITQCPAYVTTSKKKSGSVREEDYEVV